MTLEERVKALEERMGILEAGEVRFQRLIDEQLSTLTREILANIAQMKTWNEDIEEHYKSHHLDKKSKPYSNIYNTIVLDPETDTSVEGRNIPQRRNISRLGSQQIITPQPSQQPQHKE